MVQQTTETTRKQSHFHGSNVARTHTYSAYWHELSAALSGTFDMAVHGHPPGSDERLIGLGEP